jgi:hypothetical protein
MAGFGRLRERLLKILMDLSNESLLEFSDQHLAYELVSLFSALEWFAKTPATSSPKTLAEAINLQLSSHYLIAVIIHSRCLYEFFYIDKRTSSRRGDDALAAHFFSAPGRWEALRPRLTNASLQFFRRANKEVLHLTYSRLALTDLTRKWNLKAIVGDILNAALVFAENADSSKLHKNVTNDLVLWKDRLNKQLAFP